MKPTAFYEPTRDTVHNVDCHYRAIDLVMPHFHQSIEISYLVRGKCDFYIGSERFELLPGQITFVPSYFVHSVKIAETSDEKPFAYVVIIPKKYFAEFAAETQNAQFFYLDDVQKNKKIGELIVELTQSIGNMSEFVLKSYVNMILGYVAQSYEPTKLKSADNDLMIKIIKYIDAHYNEKITLNELACNFGYSKYHFSRLFNHTFKCNLNSYVNSVRAHAVNEYKGAGKKTERILDSGFTTLSSYYRATKPHKKD